MLPCFWKILQSDWVVSPSSVKVEVKVVGLKDVDCAKKVVFLSFSNKDTAPYKQWDSSQPTKCIRFIRIVNP